MASISDHLTEIYVFVDEWMKKHPHSSAWRRSPNRYPNFTDAETITIGLMQGVLGVDTLKQTYMLVHDNDRKAFTKLPYYKQWVRRLHALTSLVGQIAQAAAFHVFSSYSARLFVLDSNPYQFANRFATAGLHCCVKKGPTLVKAQPVGSLASNCTV